MSETFYEDSILGEETVLDGDGTEFLEGTLSDPPPPEGNPTPLPLESNVWAEEFYDLEVE